MKHTSTLIIIASLFAVSARGQVDSGTTTTTTITTTTAPAPPPPPPTSPTNTYIADEPAPVYNNKVSRIRFGAFIAPNISWMHPTAAKSDDGQFSVESGGSKIGFTYGLMAEYFFAPNYGLISGIQINSTGGKMTATNINKNPGNTDQVTKAVFDYRLQFLEIPLALKLKTDNINGFKFFGQLGLTAGINVGKKADYEVTSRVSGRDTLVTGDKIKITGAIGAIAPVMLQMNIGAGAEYPLSNRLTAYFGLFFNNGFAPDATAPQKFDNEKLGYSGEFRDGNTRLNNFSLRLGLFF